MATLKYKNGSSWVEYPTTGANASIGGITAKMGNYTTGTPGVTVSLSGPATVPTFDFTFTNLKGATGDPGDKGDTGPRGNVLSAVCRTNSSSQTNTVSSATGYFYQKYINSTVGSFNLSNGFTVSTYYIHPADTGYYSVECFCQLSSLGWGREGQTIYKVVTQTSTSSNTSTYTTLYSGEDLPNLHGNMHFYMPPKMLYVSSTSIYIKHGAMQTAVESSLGNTGNINAYGTALTVTKFS